MHIHPLAKVHTLLSIYCMTQKDTRNVDRFTLDRLAVGRASKRSYFALIHSSESIIQLLQLQFISECKNH